MRKLIASRLLDPKYRGFHLIVIAIVLLLHLATHYATYIPMFREPLGNLPYFRLHALHEAEFLLIVAYAGVVLGLRGGLAAIAVTAFTSIPFVLTPYIFGREPRPNEVRDLVTQVVFILSMGLLITLLHDRDKRRREAMAQSETLREVDRVRNNFVSMAAHEMRTPMTTVAGFAELLLEQEVPESQRREWLESIKEGSTRLTNLVEEVLSVTRIEAGRLNLEITPVRLSEVLPSVMNGVGDPPPGLSFTHAIPPTLPALAVDRDKLIQILVNLVSNAYKYSPSGGSVLLTAQETDDHLVRLEIADQGLGISEEDQARLFSSFSRIDRPETQAIKGSGLGLHIVKSLAEMQGGTVGVRSTLNVGSTFHLTLPAWSDDELVGAQEEAAAEPRFAGLGLQPQAAS